MYKIVTENINEFAKFTRGNQNKLSSLGIGKIALIKSWLDEMEIENYVINDDLTINVNGYVHLINKNLIQFLDYIEFNKIKGYFICSNNQLISLKGCPKFVSDDFYCHDNKLIDLEGCPEYVGGNFRCYYNKRQFTKDEVTKLCKVKGKIFT